MSTDRELLELAAKAAGKSLEWRTPTNAPDVCLAFDLDAQRLWNPLTDDGDALRLAVKLEMLVDVDGKCCEVICRSPFDITERIISDPMPATRRAIVRAAAEIGRAMP